MKLILIPCICIVACVAQAQNISYTIDSSCFDALTLEGGMTEAEFADINQDGQVDIVSVGDHGSPNILSNEHGITVFLGDGTGINWALYQNGDFGYGGVAVGDLNNDGYQDVAYGIHHNGFSLTDFGDQLIEAAIGDGTGQNWTPWDDSLATNGEYYGMFGTDVGDVDNDGLLDIGSNSFGCCAGAHIYRNEGTGVWHQTFGFVYGYTAHYIQFGDINHDGNLDFVICNQYGSPYFGDGTGNFTLQQTNLPPPVDGYEDVSLGDIDNDGDDDLAFSGPDYAPYVYKWNNGTQQWDDCSTGLSGTNTFCARLADLDMDGYDDLVTMDPGELKIWFGNGGTSWSNTLTYTLPSMNGFSDVAIADVDHSGYPDILTWCSYTLSWFTYINKLKLFRENSELSALKITPLYPKGYECFPNNAVRFLKWISAVPNGDSSSVRIEYSSTGTAGPWTLINDAAPNNGKYQWTVPAAITSSDCYIRYTAKDLTTLITDTVMNANPFQIGVCDLSLPSPQTTVAVNVLTVFPNPFSTTATLFSSMKKGEITIVNMMGKTVQHIEGVNHFPVIIDRGKLSAGIYVLEVRGSDESISRMKIVVE
ncbi:MAG TPA: T9SS type A sorting domain-containing protein [Chitinophagales bacterium]|nr:T9SS type A sorting domain-containing protein [Chitinophagales bacterium]